ncbi:MAG: AAA family ATPase [Eggerthellaceae bacterium]|nr:AAA family ATPase [Eggerthellaceae bacterium]
MTENAEIAESARDAADNARDAADAESAHDAAADDPIFAAEQEHLAHTYDTLVRMAGALVEKMERTEREAAADKQSMAEELTMNFATYADAMETHADLNAINRVIDAYNVTQSLDAERLANIRTLLKQPYFAKIELGYKPGEPPRAFYIGAAGLSDDNCRRMVVDWRSPVAEVYYNQESGPTSYTANGRVINVDMKLRRQFDIAGRTLNAYFDTTVAIQDALLLASLSQRRSARMQAITATIQREQNLVVRHADVPVLLVSGIAGSGKTSVLMQRIAYLFYQNRETLRPEEVYLITPNPVFRRYVENVLPDLGERNPEIVTWNELATRLLPEGLAGVKSGAPASELRRIDALEAAGALTLEAGDFREVRDKGVRFLSPDQIAKTRAKFARIPAGPRLVALMREELMRKVESRLTQMAARDEAQDEACALELSEQLRLFGEVADPQDEQEAAQLAATMLRDRHAGVFAAVENDEWLRIDRIGMRLLGVDALHPLTWLYLKMALTGLGCAQAKYVMVDEVQDYTTSQLMVLARYFRRAHFLLLGDENQAIAEGTASFDEVRAVFRERAGGERGVSGEHGDVAPSTDPTSKAAPLCSPCPPIAECRLTTSYRSTPGVTALFAGLLDGDARMQVSSVRRDEEPLAIVECGSAQEWERALRAAVAKAHDAEGLTAVIAPWKSEAKRLEKLLGDSAVRLLGVSDALPESGVVLITLELAKGLEFDHVIVPDASERTFPDNGERLPKNRLYTTISRATRRITLIARGELTNLLR